MEAHQTSCIMSWSQSYRSFGGGVGGREVLAFNVQSPRLEATKSTWADVRFYSQGPTRQKAVATVSILRTSTWWWWWSCFLTNMKLLALPYINGGVTALISGVVFTRLLNTSYVPDLRLQIVYKNPSSAIRDEHAFYCTINNNPLWEHALDVLIFAHVK